MQITVQFVLLLQGKYLTPSIYYKTELSQWNRVHHVQDGVFNLMLQNTSIRAIRPGEIYYAFMSDKLVQQMAEHAVSAADWRWWSRDEMIELMDQCRKHPLAYHVRPVSSWSDAQSVYSNLMYSRINTMYTHLKSPFQRWFAMKVMRCITWMFNPKAKIA